MCILLKWSVYFFCGVCVLYMLEFYVVCVISKWSVYFFCMECVFCVQSSVKELYVECVFQSGVCIFCVEYVCCIC